MGEGMKITDKMRLDWLSNGSGIDWIDTKVQVYNENNSWQGNTLRQAIDTAIKAERRRKL